MFDVAGQQQWKPCENTPEPQRNDTRCGFKGGDEEFEWNGTASGTELRVESLGDVPAFVVIPTFRVEGKLYQMTRGPILTMPLPCLTWALSFTKNKKLERKILNGFRDLGRLYTISLLYTLNTAY